LKKHHKLIWTFHSQSKATTRSGSLDSNCGSINFLLLASNKDHDVGRKDERLGVSKPLNRNYILPKG
jgi:hypothetical protein